VGGPGYFLRRTLALISAVSACAEPLPIPDDVLATAVVVSGTRAYRVDTLAERPWLVSDDPLYLLEYADEVDALPWPEEPVEITLDKTSTVALAPMPERWRLWRAGQWQAPDDCGFECDPWAPSRWMTRGLAARSCPRLQLVDTERSLGGRAARWDSTSVLQPEIIRPVRLLSRGNAERRSNTYYYRAAARLGDETVIVWEPLYPPVVLIDALRFTSAVARGVEPRNGEGVVEVVEPRAHPGAKTWLVTAQNRIYETAGPPDTDRFADWRWQYVDTIPSLSRVFGSNLGYVVVEPDDAITIARGIRSNVAPVVGISVVAEIDGVGLLAAGRYTGRDAFRRAVLLRYDVASGSWRPYAALPGVSSIVTMVPHEGGVLFGSAEGVGYYSRTTGACTITATLTDVTQLIAMPDGTHYVRAGNGPESTVGWLVP
jgi:hypothetical protein